MSNSRTRYGAVAKFLHWLTVLLVLSMIPLGIYANGLPFETGAELARKGWFFSLHKTVGIITLLVVLVRIGWALSQPKPGLLKTDKRVEVVLAQTVHWLLYASLVLVPVTGWISHAAAEGFAPIWGPIGQTLPLVPKSPELAHTAAALHIIFERVLAVSILLHVAGALKHHFIDRDDTLRRMLPVAIADPALPPQYKSRLPFAATLATYGAALAIGAGLGLFAQPAGTLPAPILQATQSEWKVEEGHLSIVITQFGNQVEGAFGEWTAAIRFDPDFQRAQNGEVDVTVAIASLSLGSVTAQALGFDFFDAETYPTANFRARILPIIDGYQAEGVLRLKGVEQPVSFPFDMQLIDDQATMSGYVVLNRLNFGIGKNMPDETTLGFDVRVNVDLTARKVP